MSEVMNRMGMRQTGIGHAADRDPMNKTNCPSVIPIPLPLRHKRLI